MKFIKDIQNFILDRKLKGFNITNYSLNEDGSIDCNQHVRLMLYDLNKIPFSFNKIYGYFDISNNKLNNLKNCAKYIEGHFGCNHNQLESLEFGPEYVGMYYSCYNNKLITLKGCVEEVYGDFDCANNKLTSLEFCPMEVEGIFNCSNNKLEYLDRSPFIKGNLYCRGMFKSEPEFNGYCYKLIWNL